MKVLFSMLLSVVALLSATTTTTTTVNAILQEYERIAEYEKRGYSWPLKEYTPNTDGWRQLMEERFKQVAQIKDHDRRYEGYLQTMQTSFLMQNFTEYGFGLGKAPAALTAELQQAIWEGLNNGKARLEGAVEIIEGREQALFIDRPDLMKKVMYELKPYVEAWSGLRNIVPYTAYGFRLYRNGSALHMHVDKPQTHIVSFIYHIDYSIDAEPWPVFIEGYDGKTYEVILKPGDLLFYESSKCMHGRPRPFKGSWYNSIFVHYHPENWQDEDHETGRHYAVPPHWRQDITEPDETLNMLQMVGTGMKEPHCPDEWCRTQNTIKWDTPSEEGYWIAPDGVKHPMKLG